MSLTLGAAFGLHTTHAAIFNALTKHPNGNYVFTTRKHFHEPLISSVCAYPAQIWQSLNCEALMMIEHAKNDEQHGWSYSSARIAVVGLPDFPSG